ncbi:MAG: peptidylprolyl isomerase [Chitinophagaceae bacterium]|jgi:peptidyl-prolyl cis-trans isomerase D|nr:peptidylprolyl isomerase [Chitinophagaceae bacterium]
MSLIQKIQEKGAWIIVVAIAVALIAFILMDRGSSSFGQMFSKKYLGKVNGEEITRTDFDSKLSFFQQQQQGQISQDQAISNTWEYLTILTALKEQANKMGLIIGNQELDAALYNPYNPPQFMKQLGTDPQTGQYNPDIARSQLAQIKRQTKNPQAQEFITKYINPELDNIQSNLLGQKYYAAIAGGIYTPKWLAEKENADESLVAKIAYVNVPYASVSDSAVKVSDAEINEYIGKHPKQFQQKQETRTISYVTFSIVPSAKDSAGLLEKMNTLKTEFANTSVADIQTFLSIKGSDGVVYHDTYESEKVIKSSKKDSIIKAGVGAVYGPYIEGQNYVLSKLVAAAPIADSAKVRHILVATVQQGNGGQMIPFRDDSTALKRLDSAIALINSGKSFDSVAAQYSDDGGSKNKGGVYDYTPSGTWVSEFNDFAFTGKVGDKKTVKTGYGYHYIEILGQKGSTTGYKIASISKPIAASQETIDAITNAANQFAANSRSAVAFTDNAAKQKVPVSQFPNIKAEDFTIGALTDVRQLIKWVFKHNPGEVSDPFDADGKNKYVVALVTGVQKVGLMDISQVGAVVAPIIKNQKKAKIIIDTKFKGNTLEAIAQSAGVQVQSADSLSFQARFIPQIGNEPKVLGAAFNKDLQNKVSAPVAGNTGVFAVKGEAISAKPSLSNTADIQRMTRQGLIQQIGNSIFSALKDAAKIKSYFSDVY